MSYEAGSPECRNLIEAKENLIKIMNSLSNINSLDHIQTQLKEIYNELEEIHEGQRIKEN
tara:strand:- start:359 stop:538 length:180 start_codon:yes stop_codon:yes gene_type:complete